LALLWREPAAAAPASLGEPEKRASLDLILSVPLEQFQASDLPLLARWSELTVMAEMAGMRAYRAHKNS